MKVQELKEKDEKALNALLIDLNREQFNLRMQKGTGQLTQTHRFEQVRRDIARIKTVLSEKRLRTA